MIYIKLWGGLGNQLFQYFYGYSLAKKMNVGIILDISYFEKHNLRTPVILNFNIYYDRIFGKSDNIWKINILNTKQVNRIIRIPRVFNIKISKDLKYLKETRRRFMKHLQDYNYPNVYIDGYWQSYKYLIDQRSNILTILSIENNNFSDELKQKINMALMKEYISIHVRRGDYVKNRNPLSKLLLLDKSYFDFAIREAIEMFKNPKFLVFSDDINWVKKEYSKYSDMFVFVEGLKDYEELILMSHCSHNIISNSTFSWWAAYLNKNQKKIIWCPDKGFGNKDILPPNWRKIKI